MASVKDHLYRRFQDRKSRWDFLRQDPGSVTFAARGFEGGRDQSRAILEGVAGTFIQGFNHVVDASSASDLHRALGDIDPSIRGFAYEGAGMACTVMDLLTASRGGRFAGLLDGPGDGYVHLIHVGAGWGFARMRLRPWLGVRPGDPVLRWLAWDGWGFHQGYFRSRRVVAERRTEPLLGPCRAIRDQGLGRSLWFHECADPDRVGARIVTFPPSRRGDLWAGIGLASAYAGAAEPEALESLTGRAGPYRADLAQGAAFAAAAHARAGFVPEHTERAVQIITGVPAGTAATWCADSLAGLTGAGIESYQAWRAGIRDRWRNAHEQRQGA